MTCDLSAIYVSWNASDWLELSVKRLRESAEQAGVAIEVIVVDNGSTDGSLELARRLKVDKVLANRLNTGFAFAASQGVALAMAPWVLMINPDLVPEPRFVGALMEAARDTPAHVATLVPDIRFSADPAVVNSRGIQVDEIGIPREIGAGILARSLEAPEWVFGGSGGGSLLRRAALDAVGAFEPIYFAYLEDVDLAWRLQTAGYRARFVHDARACHAGSVGTGPTSREKAWLVARNRRLLFASHGPRTLRARSWRLVTEVGHTVIQTGLLRAGDPVLGRLSAIRLCRYRRLVNSPAICARGSGSDSIDLPQRTSFRATLRRKLDGNRHMIAAAAREGTK